MDHEEALVKMSGPRKVILQVIQRHTSLGSVTFTCINAQGIYIGGGPEVRERHLNGCSPINLNTGHCLRDCVNCFTTTKMESE